MANPLDGKIKNAQSWPKAHSAFLSFNKKEGNNLWDNVPAAYTGQELKYRSELMIALSTIPWVDADIEWVNGSVGLNIVNSSNTSFKWSRDLIADVVKHLNGKSTFSETEKAFIKKYDAYLSKAHADFSKSATGKGAHTTDTGEKLMSANGITEADYNTEVLKRANELISGAEAVNYNTYKKLSVWSYISLNYTENNTKLKGFALSTAQGSSSEVLHTYEFGDTISSEDKANAEAIKQYQYFQLFQKPPGAAPNTPEIAKLDDMQNTWLNMWKDNVLATAAKNKTISDKLSAFTGFQQGSTFPKDKFNSQTPDTYKKEAYTKIQKAANTPSQTEKALSDKYKQEIEGVARRYASAQMEFYQTYFVTLQYQEFIRLSEENKAAVDADPTSNDFNQKAKDYFNNQKTNIKQKITKLNKESANEIAQNKQQTTAAKLSKKEVESRQRANLQCALLKNIHEIKSEYQSKYVDSGNRRNRRDLIRVSHGASGTDQNEIINKLLGKNRAKLEPFMNVTPDIISAMVPMVRLFRVRTNGRRIIESEFVFDQFTGQNPDRKIMFDDVDRGDGVGLKEFSFSFHGGNPAMSRKDIKAKLVMYFQTFSDFLATRKNGKEKYRFVDLLLFGEKKYDKKIGFGKHSINQYDPSYYRIRADVGWFIRKDIDFKHLISGRQLGDGGDPLKNFSKALEEINQSFFLNMIEHNIDIREDGSVMVTAEYQAYIESATKTAVLDALSDETLIKQRETLNQKVEGVLYNQCSKEDRGPGASQFQTLIGVAEILENKYLEGAYQSIMTRLITRKLVYTKYINKRFLNDLEPGKWSKKPKLLSPNSPEVNKIFAKENDGAKSNTKKKTKDVKKAASKSKKANKFKDFKLLAPNSDLLQLNYFYINDLVDVVLDCKRDKRRPELKKTKVILGSFSFENKTINIGEVPVSTAYFYEWMTDNVISKGLKTFPLMNFIRSLSNNLINNMLSEQCAGSQSDLNIEFRTTTSLSTKKIPAKQYMLDLKGGDNSLRSYIPERMTSNDAFHYLIIYAMAMGESDAKTGFGDVEADGRKGIHHLHVGRNRGIVKKISFEKTDIPYSREARFFRHGFDGLAQIGAVYNVKIDMIGNTIFYPGMLIYIDPRGIGGRNFDPTVIRSDANTLGFGGYHIVTKVDSTITTEGYKTTVTAMWNYTGEKKSTSKGKRGAKSQKHYLSEKANLNCKKLIKKISVAIEKWNKGDRKNLL